MPVNPVAVEVVPKNFQAIISEGGTKDLGTTSAENSIAFLEGWLDSTEHGGYFVRDENSPFDCELIMTEAFNELYELKAARDPIFIQIIRK